MHMAPEKIKARLSAILILGEFVKLFLIVTSLLEMFHTKKAEWKAIWGQVERQSGWTEGLGEAEGSVMTCLGPRL